MGKTKPAKSKSKKFQKCHCIERTVKGYCNSIRQCPHLHFKNGIVDRDELSRNDYLNLLCTPLGYRWPPIDNDGGDEEENTGSLGAKIPKRFICKGQKVKKPDGAYVHNFLAEIWTLLTPEMINRLKEMLQNEFNMTPEEAQQFIDKQREVNIENSSTASIFKKSRTLNDGTVVWDTYVKLRRRNMAQYCKSSKFQLGFRNWWIKQFSEMFSDKLSSYMLDTMCSQRTDRQQEIAHNLLNRFNNLLEQKASMENPKTTTHKVMVVVADRLSLWLDKNVKMSKEVHIRLKKLKEEEEKRRLMEEKRDREEARNRKLNEVKPETEVEPEYESAGYRSEDEYMSEEASTSGTDDNKPEPPAPPVTNARGDEPKADVVATRSVGGGIQGTKHGDEYYTGISKSHLQIQNVGGVEGFQPPGIFESSASEAPPDSAESFLSSAKHGFKGQDVVGIEFEPSKDGAALVEEIKPSARKVDVIYREDHKEFINDVTYGEDHEKVNDVLRELARIIAETPGEHTALQEAIKDVLGKELEEKLGDKDAKMINLVAGKVGTWVEKMVEKVELEYGERRWRTRARSLSPPRKQPTDISAKLFRDLAVPFTGPKHYNTVQTPVRPPVSQKPKGPIFKLRKVDTGNVFNVAGITHTKAKQKIREARGQPPLDDRFDVKEWAEWAEEVSEVGQNWAKWIGGITREVLRQKPDPLKKRLSTDAKQWKTINKNLQREGEVWMKKALKSTDSNKDTHGEKPKAVSA